MVSIVIPTYNRATVLPKTLESIMSQTYEDWECLVVDDHSKDKTSEIVANLSQRDARIKWLKRPDNALKGANACRNFGLDHAAGDHVVFFDSDDLMLSNYLKAQLKAIEKHAKPFVICKSQWIQLDGTLTQGFRASEIYSKDPINDYIGFKIFWPINAVLYKKHFLLENGLRFDESLQQSQEYDFHVRVLKTNTDYAIVDQALLQIVALADSISYSSKNNDKKVISSLKVRYGFLSDPDLKLKDRTVLFLLNDMHRILYQQAKARNKAMTKLAAGYYLKGHKLYPKLTRPYYRKHYWNVQGILLIYLAFGKGYRFLKKSNTFGFNH